MTLRGLLSRLFGFSGWALLATNAGAPALGSCTTRECTAIGCQNMVEIALTNPPVAIPSAWVEVCLNEDCVNVFLESWGNTCRDTRSDDERLWVTTCVSEEEGTTLQVIPSPDVSLTNGDTLQVSAQDADANVIFDETTTLEYTPSRPNGEGCAPECHWASVEL